MIRAGMRPITAADLMNPKVLAVRDDLTLRELAAFLIRNQITGAPVEDGAGRLVGLVSLVEVARAVLVGEDEEDEEDDAADPDGSAAELDDFADLDPAAGDLLVRDIMTPAVDSVPEDATVSEVATRMLDSQVHRLLVTRDGVPVGIVTTSDLLGLLVDE
jgi:CBS domain-containing protein